jgi:Cu+-exporting ATPase
MSRSRLECWCCFGRSAYEIISGTGAGYLDSFNGFVFFLLVGKLFQQKTYAGLAFERDYKSYFPSQ